MNLAGFKVVRQNWCSLNASEMQSRNNISDIYIHLYPNKVLCGREWGYSEGYISLVNRRLVLLLRVPIRRADSQ